ncbi:MAG: N-acetyl sugar amidotransferase [Desulfobacteraceae bacterium]|jgi:N-acetyl sugar amidotransferase
MKHCVRCVIPDTRPGIRFDEEGVCQACRAAEKKKKTDWEARFRELEAFCEKYRGCRGDGYDCIIAVSGGKDSHFQTYVMKEQMNMNPLLVTVDNLSWTETGRHNIQNLSEAFGCDILSLSLNRRVAKKMVRKAFETLGSPTWYWDRAVYAFPLRMAIQMGIQVVVYGENINYEYGGAQRKETYSAKDQIHNDVVKEVALDSWLDEDISMKDLNPILYPSDEEIERAGLEPTYLSYFVPWDGYRNHLIAKRFGFKTLAHEWNREGFIEDYDQIDSPGYLVHPWLKYPKFGHARTTDVCCNLIRTGRMTREQAVELVREHDHKLDQRALDDFLAFTGYTTREFWDIVDRFYNRDLFEQVRGEWRLKRPVE